tara:strand:- start:47 stop:250 length:204 start_codon:yes stop_codon:yes gene_type:complete
MKKNTWLVHLYEETDKINLLKVMDFETIKDISYVLGVPSQTISNYFHGLIKPRGVLNYCIIYQSIPL